ncbi:MAG: arginase [Bacillota bacterium]
MQLAIIGVPVDLGANRRGTDMGPSAVRYAGLNHHLKTMGFTVYDLGNIDVPIPETTQIKDPRLKYLEEIVKMAETLATKVEHVLLLGHFPLVIGGDHSISLGTLTGLARVKPGAGLIWIDAHGDFNTLETTLSGNIHGMSLSAIVGRGHPALVNCGNSSPKVAEQHTVLVGVRDLDPEERLLLKASNVTVFTMQNIDELGIAAVMQQATRIAGQAGQGFHVSFDMDVLDTEVVSGVGTPVFGGITYREAHLAMELVARSRQLVSLELVEVNPILDRGGNITAQLAVELACSALGKTIF